jgi:hypothetical protein
MLYRKTERSEKDKAVAACIIPSNHVPSRSGDVGGNIFRFAVYSKDRQFVEQRFQRREEPCYDLEEKLVYDEKERGKSEKEEDPNAEYSPTSSCIAKAGIRMWRHGNVGVANMKEQSLYEQTTETDTENTAMAMQLKMLNAGCLEKRCQATAFKLPHVLPWMYGASDEANSIDRHDWAGPKEFDRSSCRSERCHCPKRMVGTAWPNESMS